MTETFRSIVRQDTSSIHMLAFIPYEAPCSLPVNFAAQRHSIKSCYAVPDGDVPVRESSIAPLAIPLAISFFPLIISQNMRTRGQLTRNTFRHAQVQLVQEQPIIFYIMRYISARDFS